MPRGIYGTRRRHESKEATLSPTSVDIGWAAGFIEGEGTFRLLSSPMVRACQVNPEPLVRLQRMFGGVVSTAPAKGNRQALGNWRVYGARARGVMLTLYPQMSEKRQQQIVEALGVGRVDKRTRAYKESASCR